MAAVGLVNTQATSKVASISGIGNIAATVAGVATAANPVGAVLTGAGGVVNLFSRIFSPSECSKNSSDMAAFLKCWNHPIPNGFVPVWNTRRGGFGLDDGGKTDSAWAVCPGASGGNPPAGGCPRQPYSESKNLPYNTAGTEQPAGTPNLAPPGAVASVRGGGWQFAGGATGVVPSSPTAPFVPSQTGQLGTTIPGAGVTVPASQTTGAALLQSAGGAVPSLPGGLSTGTFIIIALVAAGTLALALSQRR